jgi:cytochrome d ubiquinol oxidase subunit II
VTLPEVTALLMLGGLVIYALTGGADFGGGVWDLLATGPRARAQRTLIEQAIAPVWEANHVWLIFVVVVMFTGFPLAYAAIGTRFHIPVTIMLFGIILRGSAFVFRHYGGASAAERWGRVFAVASLVTPFFLGVIVGAITSGTSRADGYFTWVDLFPAAVGLLAVALFAFLAAVYLTCETRDAALRDDFRARALVAGVAAAPTALVAALAAIAAPGTAHFRDAFFGSWWTWPLHAATAAAAVIALWALVRRRFRLARAAAAAQVALIIVGWALAQRPYLIAPDVGIDAAAAPRVTLILLILATSAGMVVLAPSIYWLMRVFKSRRAA